MMRAVSYSPAGVDLDFSRYGETLFEVLFAGGRMAGGGNVIGDGKKLDTNVRHACRIACSAVLSMAAQRRLGAAISFRWQVLLASGIEQMPSSGDASSR